MRVIGHQHVGRAGESVARAGVEQGEPPRVVERGREPAGRTVVDGEGPVNEGVGAVVLGWEAGEVAAGRRDHSLTLAATGSIRTDHSLTLAATWNLGSLTLPATL